MKVGHLASNHTKRGIDMFKTAVHVSIDIETGNLSPDQFKFETQFLKHHPSTKDHDKQTAQIQNGWQGTLL